MTRRAAPTDGTFATEGDFQRHVVAEAMKRGWGITSAADAKRDEELAGYRQPPAPLDGLIFHPRIMYRSEPGWPDLTLIRRRDRRLVFAEMKTDNAKKSRLSPRQVKVLDLLAAFASDVPMLCDAAVHDDTAAGRCGECPPWIQVFVWRPGDLPQIYAVLA